jgi:uncharacterized protein with HEPN domain
MEQNNRNLASIWDMIQAIQEIQEDTANFTYEKFEQNRTVRRAVERNFEILGEAGGRVSDEFRHQHPEIDWRKIIGLRNIIIHRYEKVESAVLWEVIVSNLPTLSNQLKLLYENLE